MSTNHAIDRACYHLPSIYKPNVYTDSIFETTRQIKKKLLAVLTDPHNPFYAGPMMQHKIPRLTHDA